MTDAVIFYHNPMSRGRIVSWLLEEVGAPYEVHLLRFDRAEHKAPEFLALNPMGKLPAIVHRGVVVSETPAICAYLADAFPEAELAPRLDDPLRGSYLRWLFFGAGCLEYAITDRMFERPAPTQPGTLGYGTFEAVMNTLEAALSPGPFLLGERFSAADVVLGSQIAWGISAGAVQPLPTFKAWQAAYKTRPAFLRAVAKNRELMAQLGSSG